MGGLLGPPFQLPARQLFARRLLLGGFDLGGTAYGRSLAAAGIRLGKRPRLASVERWARQRNIRVQYDGQGSIWTTNFALNEALGLIKPAFENERYPASLV